MPSKWLRTLQEKHQSEHLERVRKMRPVVDSGPPRELPLSGKKEIERRRFLERVEKGNRALLDRLGKAMEHKHIDNERHDKIKFQSLQAGLKKLELARVTTENQILLERIQSAIPEYNHNEWEREAAHREFYLKNMTEYPEQYVPHYPPLRKKYFADLALKEAEKAAKRGTLTSRGKATSSGSGSGSGAGTGINSGKVFGTIEPPDEEPPVGLESGRPVA